MDDDLTPGRAMKWLAVGFAFIVVLIILASVASMVTLPFRAAGGLAERTLNPANIERTYERFHDLNREYLSRLAQVADTKRALDAERDAAERSRLGIELRAQRGSCRDIVARYNADASKTNRDIFRGREAPASLSLEACDR